jgi:hypothetical protein
MFVSRTNFSALKHCEHLISDMSGDTKYDVALSFLAEDERTARAIADKLEASGFNVFFFPRNQEELAGTNGMETMRDPFFQSRVNIVLFREPWGHTPWTRVEQTAITERCLEKGWDSLMFVQLDSTSVLPKWLPKTHVRFALELYGIEQLVGAIKSRVQEQGGVVAPPTAVSEAKRVSHEARYLRDREALMRDRRWIETVIHQSLRDTFRRLEELGSQANKEHGFGIVIGSQDYQNCIMRAGHISVGVIWRQPIYNSVLSDEHGECYLRVAEFSGAIAIPGRNEMVWQQAELLKEHRFKPDVSETRDLIWITGKGERTSSDKLADRIVMILLDLISRMNRGGGQAS